MPSATPMPNSGVLTGTDSAPRFRQASFQSQDANKLEQILRADPMLAGYLDKADQYRIQVIFSQIEHNRSNQPQLITWTFRQDESFYYPASLVKLPVAIFALERLEELGLDKNDRFEIHPANDCSRYSADACDTVEQCIEQIFVYSNNTAYNRLFEFLGRDEINDRLRDLGYQGVIQRRFRPGCGGDLGLTTGAVTFYDQNGNVRHRQPARMSRRVYSPPRPDMRAGRKTRTAIGLIDEPMDFSDKNYLPLADFHQMLITLIDPSAVPKASRFALNASDQDFLQQTMAMRPRDAGGNQPDSFRKYLMIGGQARMPDTLQIMNKVGLSYGFVSDVAYIRDTTKDVDFFLSATIYTNQNQIMNDAVYEYETLGYPFMRALGQAIYRYVLSRATQGGSPE
ncbi:serine hydrolase [Thiorhodovibrio frisius]|nr:serine hydrolase [Thiorhodovibrio frisius]